MATTSTQPRVVGYNVQSVVETEHHLIVAHEVTKYGYDRDALAMMARAAKDAMASDAIEAIADKGYYKGEEIVACEQDGIAVTSTPGRKVNLIEPTSCTLPTKMSTSAQPENA